ncbi:MAG TPA: molybdopterin-dependent oxidoreductase, partial [Thermomicrobiales bacterium]|nr:molybdopterin-dependent oxidoreductase [Thermomicrobiales bacterium]
MDIIMDLRKKLPNMLAGLLAGTVAAIVTALAMAASRYWLGIMPPPEAVPDRIAPMLDIETFFSMFSTYGGYNGLKQFGIVSGLRGLLITGIVVGIAYALVVESRPSRRSPRWFLGVSRPAWTFIGAAVLVAWVGFVAFLWPVLPANYRGVPYSQARILSIVALLTWFSIFAATVMLIYHDTTQRLGAAQVPVPDDALTSEPAPERPVTTLFNRRAFLNAILGAALAVPVYDLLKRLYDDATFSYDGRPYSGEDIEPVTPTNRFYTVTKNVVDPDVDRDMWRLEIRGAIDNDLTLSFGDLQDHEQVDQESTLMCISNRIGAGLFSNAQWRGVRLGDVLMSAGVHDDAYEVKLTGADAYVDTFGMDYALDENTLL